jgi:hypothetical protein
MNLSRFTGKKEKLKTKNFKILAVGFLSTIHRISRQPLLFFLAGRYPWRQGQWSSITPSDMNGLAIARQRWPKNTNGLSAPVRAVFTAWEQCQTAEQDEALDQIDGFTRPPGRFTSKQKCRDLNYSIAVSTSLVCDGSSTSFR